MRLTVTYGLSKLLLLLLAKGQSLGQLRPPPPSPRPRMEFNTKQFVLEIYALLTLYVTVHKKWQFKIAMTDLCLDTAQTLVIFTSTY